LMAIGLGNANPNAFFAFNNEVTRNFRFGWADHANPQPQKPVGNTIRLRI
jgi:hypothetical protein